eukprot:TRINITY_DN49836_c0_g1_i1.p1 TRINITY_DN49836_c0_g1~~TRINITY_DN49836_c0_g1_i1.p1  ORF type:complete len:346 (+),score=35.45 TRINITY_DN49836_c0_g1_i1:111-1148(+)
MAVALARLHRLSSRASAVVSIVNCRGPSRGSFTIRENKAWTRDLLEFSTGVRVMQEATDWERALPYGLGAVVWGSSLAFCQLVEAIGKEQSSGPVCEFWRDKAVLELGSGCGAAGLAVAARGAKVTLTDRKAVLPLLHRNTTLNDGLSVTVRELAWETATADDFLAGSPAISTPSAVKNASAVSDAADSGETTTPKSASSVPPSTRLSTDPQSYDIVIGTDLVDIDPDRTKGTGHFDALRHALGTMLRTSPDCLAILIFEERGDLKLDALGSLFGSLARNGQLWEFRPPPRLSLNADATLSHRRYLCLSSGEGNAVEEWWRLLGEGTEPRRWHEGDFAVGPKAIG